MLQIFMRPLSAGKKLSALLCSAQQESLAGAVPSAAATSGCAVCCFFHMQTTVRVADLLVGTKWKALTLTGSTASLRVVVTSPGLQACTCLPAAVPPG